MSEEKTITVKAYRDKDGLPTCAVNFRTGESCQFLRGYSLCQFSRYDLDRRDNGEGSLIPCENCIVWKGESK